MADIDFFGYQRSKTGTYLYSSDYAAIYFANANQSPTVDPFNARKAGLVQNCACAYQHSVQPRFEAGSSELYWVAGQSMGRINVGRLIGDGGIMEGINTRQNQGDLRNGAIGGIDVKVGRLGDRPIFQAGAKQDVLVMKGCVMSSWGLQFSAGGLDISESFSIECALMKRKIA